MDDQSVMSALSAPSSSAPTEKRVGQIIKLKPEFVEQYKECHAKVWPAVLKQILDCNIKDCGLLSFPSLLWLCSNAH